MRQFRCLLVGLTFLGILQPLLFGQPTVDPIPTPIPSTGQSPKPLAGQKIVFVVNGAGESTVVSTRLRTVTEDMNVRMNIQTISWCRAALPALEHYKDCASQLKAAASLAGQTTRVHKEHPDAEIYYLAHSTGVRIALLGAEMAPAKSINRIILVASAVGSSYDLRPALRASQNGIDHFWSREDEFLERVTEEYGLPDGTKGRAAGQTGFLVPAFKDAEGWDAYKNVRQYRWAEDKAFIGGHFVWVSNMSLKRYIVPLIAPQAAKAAPAAFSR